MANPNPAADVYTLSVSVRDTAGCETRQALGPFEVILQPVIVVPNVFTPNNDGQNDVFRVTSNNTGVHTFRLWIYDRSGRELFQTTDLSRGWDGRLRGADASPGVYFYRVEVTYINNQRQERIGTVNLLR